MIILLGAKPNAGNDKRDQDEKDTNCHPNDHHHPILAVKCSSTVVAVVDDAVIVTCVDVPDLILIHPGC